MWIRLKALIVKEFLAILADPKSRAVVIGPPIIQLVVFTYAATLEVRNVDVAIINRDSGRWGQELVYRLDGAPTFRTLVHLDSPSQLRRAIDRQEVLGAVEIGPTFSRDIEAGRTATLLVALDGRRSNAAQIVAGYLQQIVQRLEADLPAPRRPAVEVISRNWFNPNLEYPWFMVPSLLATIALVIGLVVTALSIARERELGTFDQLMVSPLRTHEVLLGKLIPPLLIGLLHVTLFILAAVFLFGVPLRGSLGLLYASALVYLAALVGLGLFLSSLARTQQQAILGAFLLMVPATLLSGFATPIENMPDWLQPVTRLNPLRYFLVVVKGIFLKDLPAGEVLRNTVPLAVIAAVTLSAAAWLFRRRME